MSQAKGGRSEAQDETPPEPEAEANAAPGDDPRPTPEPGPGHGHGHECLEWCPICRSAELLKGVGVGVNSPEIRQQLQSLQNEAMQVFKAFATAYSERTGDDPFSRRREGEATGAPREPEPPKSPDTPIDISIE